LITNRSEASWPEKEKIGNINIRRIGHGKKKDKFLFPFRALGYAARLHKHTNFDFVWSRRAFYSGLVALFFKYKTKVPYLLTPEFEDVDRDVHNKIWLWSYFYKRIFREAKITQGITRYLAKRSRNFGNKKEIVLIPDGVDLQIFKNKLSDPDRQQTRKDVGIKDNEMFLITRFGTRETLEELVKSINWLVFKIGIQAKLVVLGVETDEENLKHKAEAVSVDDRVIFLQSVSDQEISKYLEAADVFVRPDTIPTSGKSFLQAMAVGTPIVGTEIGGTIDFLKDGQTGLFCQVNKPSSLAEAVEKYFKDKELYKSIGQNCKQFVTEKYSWDRVVDQMNLVFEKML
jgi:glycosyltransferase involved in cell wall biosynthesis